MAAGLVRAVQFLAPVPADRTAPHTEGRPMSSSLILLFGLGLIAAPAVAAVSGRPLAGGAAAILTASHHIGNGASTRDGERG